MKAIAVGSERMVAAVLLMSLACTGGALAVTVDLTTVGSSGTINDALFVQMDQQTTGTGVIDPFLRVQDKTNEDGYNASVPDVMPDVKTGIWTHDILLGAVGVVDYNNAQYYQFLLDINQDVGGRGGVDSFLTLNTVELWLNPTALADGSTYALLTGSGATLKYDMDAGADSSVELDYALNSGSGQGDMYMYVPVSTLGTDLDQYLYLYCDFGKSSAGVGNPSNAGFEEWAVITPATTNSVPDGASTGSLMGMAVIGLAALRRKLRA